jgi:bifunctional isochorismate lyase/aryl carrier protein
MPTGADLVTCAATWRADPRRSILLIHDMQRYFIRFLPRDDPPTPQLLANVRALRRAADASEVPVVYTVQPGRMTPDQRGLLRDIWGPGMTDSAADREVVRDLVPRPGDVVLTKYRYSGFHGTALADTFAATGRDQIVVCGVFAHIGCLATSCDAYARDIEAFVVADAVAAFSRRDHVLALEYAAKHCAVTLSTADLITSWRGGDDGD